MRATMLLCDAAQVADGKLFVLGWGWSYVGPDPSPQALAIKFDVAWTELGVPHHWELYLEDEDGQPVVLTAPEGTSHPVEVRGDFEVPREQQLAEGASAAVPVALTFGPLPLPPGARYTWRLTVDGDSDEQWRASFTVRPAVEGGEGEES